jgi:hypothetical protein
MVDGLWLMVSLSLIPPSPLPPHQDALDACNGWEVDRQVEQAMDSLRCPPGDALVDKLSGGERRRVVSLECVLVGEGGAGQGNTRQVVVLSA